MLSRSLVILSSFCLFLIAHVESIAAVQGVEIYPLPAVFISDQALLQSDFARAISSDGLGTDRAYAIGRFGEVFRKYFKGVASTIDSQNKYRTFVAFLQIPRVSKYAVKKSDQLQDLYIPMTMTLGFANMVTGEILFTYTYTHYAKYGTTTATGVPQEQESIELYRETFDGLLEQVVASARANFNPVAIETTLRHVWKGLYVLDKGTRAGVVKGDTLGDGQGQVLSIVHAEEEFAIGLQLLGEPKEGVSFLKYTNDDIADIKKPKIMLLRNSEVGGENTSIDRNAMIYQIFINALGKKATFSLLSMDKSFYEVQNAVVETTKLENKVTQQRELPDYFLSIYIHGPFLKSLPTNKPDVVIDEYTVRACGDFLDTGGRVVYGKCVEEVISDQVVAGIRFPRTAREEVVIKNSLLKLADDFIQNVKFASYTLPVIASDETTGVSIEDKAGALSSGLVVTSYHSIGKVSGINGEVRLPIETLQVYDVTQSRSLAIGVMKFNERVPASTAGDVVLLEAIHGGESVTQKKVTLCSPSGNQGFEDKVGRLFYYAVSEGITYPFYEINALRNTLPSLSEYGFKNWPGDLNDKAEYCIEPVIRVDSQNDAEMVKVSIVTGIKLHQGNDVVWKKGMQQEWSFALPQGSDPQYVDSEVCRVMYPLVREMAKKIEIK